MSGHIEFHPHAGSAIERTSADAQRIADLLGVAVEFSFNEVLCIAGVGGSADRLVEAFKVEIGRKLVGRFDRRFASSTTTRPQRGEAGR